MVFILLTWLMCIICLFWWCYSFCWPSLCVLFVCLGDVIHSVDLVYVCYLFVLVMLSLLLTWFMCVICLFRWCYPFCWPGLCVLFVCLGDVIHPVDLVYVCYLFVLVMLSLLLTWFMCVICLFWWCYTFRWPCSCVLFVCLGDVIRPVDLVYKLYPHSDRCILRWTWCLFLWGAYRLTYNCHIQLTMVQIPLPG